MKRVKGWYSGEDKCDRDEQFYICIYVCGYACVRVHSYTRILKYIHPHIHTHTHTRVRVCARCTRVLLLSVIREIKQIIIIIITIIAVDYIATARPPIVDDL